MKSRIISWGLGVLLLIQALASDGQVVLNLQLPPSGITTKNQLWNMSLVNVSNETLKAQVEMILSDSRNSQRVLTGTSKIFFLAHGARQLLYSDVMPVTYTASSAAYNVDPSPTGFLPVGSFSVCFTVIKIDNDQAEKLGDQCENIEIEPLQPPSLVLPSDSEAVEVNRPLFTWLPPAPASLFTNLLYDWRLVEVLPLQNAGDALEQNPPLLQQLNIAFTNFQYPGAAMALDTGKIYAWRVTAKSNMAPIANSEVWTFRVKGKDTKTAVPLYDAFIKLKQVQEAAYGICTGKLHFQYINEINDKRVTLKIVDLSAAAKSELALDSNWINLRYGQNLIELDLLKMAKVEDKHIYLLELVNGHGEYWYLKFEYRKTDLEK